VPSDWLRGTFETTFRAASADGYPFNVRADGQWRRRSLRQHDPRSAAADYVTGEVTRLAATCPILATTSLEYRANAHLGRAVSARGMGVRVRRVRVHVDADPDAQDAALARMRLRVRVKNDREDRQQRIAQATEMRDLLREDPTLAIAHLLLESPAAVTDQAAVNAINALGDLVASHSPGAAWVTTARLLENFLGNLQPDAKKLIVERFCGTLREFGAREEARLVMRAHGISDWHPDSNEVRDSPNGHQKPLPGFEDAPVPSRGH
jgi:hypothetical protein